MSNDVFKVVLKDEFKGEAADINVTKNGDNYEYDISTFFWSASCKLKIPEKTFIDSHPDSNTASKTDVSGFMIEIYNRRFFGKHISVSGAKGHHGNIKLNNGKWAPDNSEIVKAIYLELIKPNNVFTFSLIDNGCFPKNAMAQTPDGPKQCGKLKINDMILVGDNKYENIVLFSHFDKNIVSNFTQLTLSNGKTVTATGSHLITVYNGNQEIMKSFDSIVVGDKLHYKNKLRSVKSKQDVVGKGLVCPVTSSGNIVVDNVLCTCHASRSSMKILSPIVNALAATNINVPNKLVKQYNAIR
jgi:hypothetical protein